MLNKHLESAGFRKTRVRIQSVVRLYTAYFQVLWFENLNFSDTAVLGHPYSMEGGGLTLMMITIGSSFKWYVQQFTFQEDKYCYLLATD